MSQVLYSFSHGSARGSPPRRRLRSRWMSRGACRHADPELFFPISTVTGPAAWQVEAAKAVCGLCVRRSAAQHGEHPSAGPGTRRVSRSRR